MGKHLGIAYNLRLPAELKEKISESAKKHNRSMNADIVARLEQTFNNPILHEPESVIEMVDKVIEIIEHQDKTIKSQNETIDALQKMLSDLSVSTNQAIELLKNKAP